MYDCFASLSSIYYQVVNSYSASLEGSQKVDQSNIDEAEFISDSRVQAFYASPTITISEVNGKLYVLIETERLKIQPFKLNELGNFKSLIQDHRNMLKVYDGEVISDEAAERLFNELNNRWQAFNPLGGLSVYTKEGEYICYFNLKKYEPLEPTASGSHLTMDGTMSHVHWRQGYSREVTVAIAHYIRRLFSNEERDNPIIAKMKNYIDGISYFDISIVNSNSIAHKILQEIGVQCVSETIDKDGCTFKLYRMEIGKLHESPLQVKKHKNHENIMNS